MKTTNEPQAEAGKAKRELTRKRKPSLLDPFTEHLLQMDDETKTIQEMAAWLKTQGVETSASNVSAFLISRRRRRELVEQLNLEKDLGETVAEWFEAEAGPKLETIMGVFKLLVLKLATRKEMDPQLLKLADRLARTVIGQENDRSRAEYRTRKLVMEEAKHAEWVKCEQQRALELSLDEAKKYPAVADMFRAAFAALEEAMEEAKRPKKAPRTNIQQPEKHQARSADEALEAAAIEEDEEEEEENQRPVEAHRAEARRGKGACGRRGKGKAPRSERQEPAEESSKFQGPGTNEVPKAPEIEDEDEEDGEEANPVEMSEIELENAKWRKEHGF
jgi:hypothetical protein